ncbi:hypothetical protein ACFUMJ_02405 [Streptomyces olivaceus]|uniref:hypothetical protein n=1 Tax=Streptomyces TaxID=1883 RepID=UPI001FB62AC4|nr:MULTISPECIES: hypothetical protein [unclassified Streptomyces]MCU8589949.1 hypothetical protein [Streptomyces sp. A13(2022)]UOG78253.1 hypothetical protein L6J92_03120 [Streptomyces sp. CB09030]
MTGERRLLDELMKAVEQESPQFVVRPHVPGLRKFAAFAHVAERFGYHYLGHAQGSTALNNPYFLFRRAPDAGERAIPVTDVELLYSQMVVDASGRYTPRVLSNLFILPIVLAVFLVFPGYTVMSVLVAVGVWLAFFACYLVGLGVTRHRKTKHLARLSVAGVEWPPRATA